MRVPQKGLCSPSFSGLGPTLAKAASKVKEKPFSTLILLHPLLVLATLAKSPENKQHGQTKNNGRGQIDNHV
jgi:hypothetical protein